MCRCRPSRALRPTCDSGAVPTKAQKVVSPIVLGSSCFSLLFRGTNGKEEGLSPMPSKLREDDAAQA